MNETIQNIIVGIIVALCASWSLWQIFFVPKGGCGCGTKAENCSSCADCQLLNACKKQNQVCTKDSQKKRK